MSLKKAKNVFESSRFAYYSNKVFCNLFITFYADNSGQELYHAVTTSLDVLIFISSMALSAMAYLEMSKMPLKRSSRSIILEMSFLFNSNLRMMQPFFVIFVSFWNRRAYFELLKLFHLIDLKVRNFNF